jgi:hypothetical protein
VNVSLPITVSTPTANPNPVCLGSNSQLNVTAGYIAGYTMNSNSGVSFVDISATGTSVGTVADDGEYNITLPTAFAYYGTLYTTARIGSNGVVVFGTTTGDIIYNNSALPQGIASSTIANTGIITGTGNSLAALVPAWDDITPSSNVTTSITTKQIGNIYYIQWTNEDNFNATGTGVITFQVQLNLSTGVINFVYPDFTYGAVGYDGGASATIGIQKDATTAIQYSYNTASITDGQSISFTPITSGTFNYAWSNTGSYLSRYKYR